jgi:hypothetical protein
MTTTNFPLDPDIFVEAFREIGYTPIQREWIVPQDRACCALTGLAMKRAPELREDGSYAVGDMFSGAYFFYRSDSLFGFKMTTHERDSFLEGYDNGKYSFDAPDYDQDWVELGDEVWQRLRKEFIES